ncbi:MAG TPA: hypothetical protein VKU00_00990 [Chthonomonadaceae bacterium]|nr:hypothetical protein [Chthonomonadaceae bacterium]
MTGKAKRLLIGLIGGVLLSAVVGCNNNSAPLTKTEESSFKGGPMPESAREIMQQKLKEAAAKGGTNAAPGPNGGGPASSTPSGPASSGQ